MRFFVVAALAALAALLALASGTQDVQASTAAPSRKPSMSPSKAPTKKPTAQPSSKPSKAPSGAPATPGPSASPTTQFNVETPAIAFDLAVACIAVACAILTTYMNMRWGENSKGDGNVAYDAVYTTLAAVSFGCIVVGFPVILLVGMPGQIAGIVFAAIGTLASVAYFVACLMASDDEMPLASSRAWLQAAWGFAALAVGITAFVRGRVETAWYAMGVIGIVVGSVAVLLVLSVHVYNRP